jgi:nitroreductase
MIVEIARRRKSIRKFKPDRFDINILFECIDAAKEAPSGSNAQPWHFVIVEDFALKEKLREVCESGERKFYSHVRGELAEWLHSKGLSWQKPFLTDAPYIVAVFAYKKAPYSRESVWIAVAYFLLALEEKGIASLTYTPPNRDEVAELLKCPPEYRLEVLIPTGYPDEQKVKEPRKGLDEIVSLNYFGEKM